MLPKLLFIIVSLALIAAAVLGLHQHRLEALHAMADLHVQMDADRKATWDAQARIAEGTHPIALQQAIQRVGMNLQALPSTADDGPVRELWPDPTHFAHAPEHMPARD